MGLVSRVFVKLACALSMCGVLLVGGCHRSAAVKVPIEGLTIPREYAASIEVKNWRGNVQVYASDKYKAPEVFARVHPLDKTAPRNTNELRKMVLVRAVSSEEGGKRVLRVTGDSTQNPPGPVSLDLHIRIPRAWGVHVTNAGGEVELVGIGGPISVENGGPGKDGGEIQVRTGIPMKDAVTLTTTNGDVVYQIGPGSTGAIDLQANNGLTAVDSDAANVDNTVYQPDRWLGTLDHGNNPIVMRSGKGDVRIVVVENAATLGRQYWDGWPEWPTSPRWVAKLGGY
jgi:hypothetical protein